MAQTTQNLTLCQVGGFRSFSSEPALILFKPRFTPAPPIAAALGNPEPVTPEPMSPHQQPLKSPHPRRSSPCLLTSSPEGSAVSFHIHIFMEAGEIKFYCNQGCDSLSHAPTTRGVDMTCITRRATSKTTRTSNRKTSVQARGKEKTQHDKWLNILYCSHMCPRVRCGAKTVSQGNETTLSMFSLPCTIHT